jgi:hypothetical protein
MSSEQMLHWSLSKLTTEVLTAMTTKSDAIFWDITPYNLAEMQ